MQLAKSTFSKSFNINILNTAGTLKKQPIICMHIRNNQKGKHKNESENIEHIYPKGAAGGAKGFYVF